ncbi:MerR family transcriptional regulator [Ottowia sp. GY511]|uniref:MerR family transcriptional regulator n=1 Tax=Ottowia flava TaxID=2675430 RepID=A0ABW4KN72_9BURK|nr:MerR family transcriptional regulator [Ottowia sp. GY511]TXK28364.1 MerR family transcriptional regulator [Ottowia sp. GY511]
MESSLPPIPAKRYFTIGEVGDLCGVKPHVLRYWEQEFTQLRPMKRRGNRRYYQHHEVLMIRRIRELLYDQGFTISGARTRLQELDAALRGRPGVPTGEPAGATTPVDPFSVDGEPQLDESSSNDANAAPAARLDLVVRELLEIREMLTAPETGHSVTL